MSGDTKALVARLRAWHAEQDALADPAKVALIAELERALAAAEKERDEAMQQRGTLIGRQESGAFTPSPLGEQLLQMEQRALAAEAREREAYEGAAKVCFKHASPAMADACAAAIRALAKERT